MWPPARTVTHAPDARAAVGSSATVSQWRPAVRFSSSSVRQPDLGDQQVRIAVAVEVEWDQRPLVARDLAAGRRVGHEAARAVGRDTARAVRRGGVGLRCPTNSSKPWTV